MALIRLQSPQDFFRIWFFWKKQAVFIFLIIIGIVMPFSYLYTPDYESTAKILILPRTGEGTIISTGTDEKRIESVSIQDVNTEIELLTSGDVFKDTIRSFEKQGVGFKVQENTWLDNAKDFIKKIIHETFIFLKFKERLSPFDANVNWLRNSLKVETSAMSNVILVSLKAESPKKAMVVLNRLLETYIKHHNNIFIKEEGVHFFRDNSRKSLQKLEAAEEQLSEFQKKWNIVNLTKQNEANIDLFSELSKEQNHIEISIEQAENRIAILRQALLKNKQDVLITKEMRTIPSIVELEKGLVPLLIKRSEILKIYTPSSRTYQNIDSQIKMLRGEIKNEIVKAIKTDELELESLRTKHKSLQKKMNSIQEEANALTQKKRLLANLERDVKLHNDNYILYASKTEDSRIFQERKKRDLSNISIAESANLPMEPAFPNKLLMLLISVFIGSFAALSSPFILEFLDHRIKTPHEVENLLSLPVVCALPEGKS